MLLCYCLKRCIFILSWIHEGTVSTKYLYITTNIKPWEAVCFLPDDSDNVEEESEDGESHSGEEDDEGQLDGEDDDEDEQEEEEDGRSAVHNL